jgi:hypothetical protein
MDWILIVAVLVLSGALFRDTLKRIPVWKGAPLALAEPVSDLRRAHGLNLAASVSDFSGERWRRHKLSATSNRAVAPDGTRSATRLGERIAIGVRRIETALAGTVPGEPATLSIFVKPDGRAAIQIELRDDGAGASGAVRFDFLQRGLIAQVGDIADAGLQALPDGWFRCWAAMPFETDRAAFSLTLLNAHRKRRYVGNGHSGLFIWGMQFERGGTISGYFGSGEAGEG